MVSSGFCPAVGGPAALPLRRGRSCYACDRRSGCVAADVGRLLRTRGRRLSRRGVGSRRPVRPDRLGGSCRFRLPIERREAGGEMARNGLVGDMAELLHAESHTAAMLTSRSGEAASTPKIVAMRPPMARRPHRGSWPSGCSTSGALGLASGAASLLADRSAALARKPAAMSGSVVAFANLSNVAACSDRYFLPGTIWSLTTRHPMR